MNERFSGHQLYFKLLGTPQVFSYGEEIQVTRRNVRALAYYLACHHGLVNRDTLKLLLWPDSPENKASTSLRETLSKLRSSIPDGEALVSTSSHAYFDQEKVHSDVKEFQELTQFLESNLKNESQTSIFPAHIIASIKQAINLWDGVRFLNTPKLPPTDSYHNWHTTFGQQLRLKQTNLLTTLIRQLVNSNNLTEAFHYVDLLSQNLNEDLDITFHYGLLNSLIDNQNYTLAQAYLEYLRPIADDHGYRLEETILKQIIDILKNPSVKSTNESEQKWLHKLSFQLPMTGQDAIIQRIVKLPSSHQGILLTGDTGIGKSRLAYELYQRLFQNHQFAHVEAFPSQAKEPFSVIRKIILQLVDRKDIQQFSTQLRRKLTPLFPEYNPDLSSPRKPLILPPNEQLKELNEGIISILTEVAANQPILVVIDDIQYCDFASFRIIQELVIHSFFHSANFLILTADEKLLSQGKNEKLKSLQNQILQIPVAPITRPEAELLISQFIDRTIPSNLMDLLYEETKGNTHLMLNTINSVQDMLINEESINQRVISNAISLPNWYETQQQQLSMDAADLLEYCVVLDSPIHFNLLEAATQWESTRIIDALDELESINFLIPVDRESVLSGYRFQHQILRTRTIEQMTLANIRKIHLDLIHAYETVFVSALEKVAANIVDHCFGAGNLRMALHYTLIGADFASQSYAPDVANQLYERMHEAIQTNPHLFTNQQIRKFYGNWAGINMQFNDFESAKIHAQYLLQQGQLRNSEYLKGAGLLYLGLASSAMQLLSEDSLDYIDQAILIFENLPPSIELIHCNVEKAYYYSTHNQQTLSNKLCQEIINTPNPDPDRENDYQWLINRTKFTLAFLYSQTAELKKADSLLSEILSTTLRNLETFAELHYRNLHAWVKFYLGKTKEAQSDLMELMSDAELLGNDVITAGLLTNLSRIQHYQGDNDAALQSTDRGLMIAERYGLHHFITSFHIIRGFVYQSAGNSEASLEEFEQAMAAARIDNHQLSINGAAIHLAIIEGYEGNKEKGFRLAKAVLDAMKYAGNHFLYLQSIFFYYSLCIYTDPDHKYSQISREDIDFYIQECRQNGLILFEIYGESLIAHLEFTQGSQNQGFQLLFNAIRLSRRNDFKMFELSTYLSLAEKKPLSNTEKNRVRTLVEELRTCNKDQRLKDSIENYFEFVAKTTQFE